MKWSCHSGRHKYISIEAEIRSCQSGNTECQSSTNRNVSRGACGQFWGFSPALHMYPEESKFILSLQTFKNTLSKTVKTHIETSQKHVKNIKRSYRKSPKSSLVPQPTCSRYMSVGEPDYLKVQIISTYQQKKVILYFVFFEREGGYLTSQPFKNVKAVPPLWWCGRLYLDQYGPIVMQLVELLSKTIREGFQ